MKYKHRMTEYKLRVRNKAYPWIKQVLDRDNNKCIQCGEIKNILVHHIDESRKTGKLNNELSNLITLCKKCHAKIHNQKLDMNNKRIKNMNKLREEGCTYQEIANIYGITQQRVQQIIARYFAY